MSRAHTGLDFVRKCAAPAAMAGVDAMLAQGDTSLPSYRDQEFKIKIKKIELKLVFDR